MRGSFLAKNTRKTAPVMVDPDPKFDAPPNPHPFRLSEGDSQGFGDGDMPVSVVWPYASGSVEDNILALLEDVAGARFADLTKARKIITELLDKAGDYQAANGLRDFIDRIQIGAPDAQFIGRRVLVWAYSLQTPRATRDLEQLAARLGVCKTRAHQLANDPKLNGQNHEFT